MPFTSLIFVTNTKLLLTAIECRPETFITWLEANKVKLSNVTARECEDAIDSAFPDERKVMMVTARPAALLTNAFLSNTRACDSFYEFAGQKMSHLEFNFGLDATHASIIFDQETQRGTVFYAFEDNDKEEAWHDSAYVAAVLNSKESDHQTEQKRVQTLGDTLKKDLAVNDVTSLIKLKSADLGFVAGLLEGVDLTGLPQEAKDKIAIWYKATLSKDQKVVLYENISRILPTAFAPLASELARERIITPVTWSVMKEATRNEFIKYLAPAEVPFALDPVPNNPYFKEPALIVTIQGRSHIQKFIAESTGPKVQLCAEHASAFLKKSPNKELSAYLKEVVENHPELLFAAKYGFMPGSGYV